MNNTKGIILAGGKATRLYPVTKNISKQIMPTLKRHIFGLIVRFFALETVLKNFLNRISIRLLCRHRPQKLGILVEEFFHKDLRGFGGSGMTVKNITGFFNAQNNGIASEVLLTSMLENRKVGLARYHDTPVIFRDGHKGDYVKNFLRYGRLINSRALHCLLTIDWYDSYQYPAQALPKTPLVIWIHDPRAKEEWEKIATVPLEFSVIGQSHQSGNLDAIVKRRLNSIQNLLELSRKYNRNVLFATQARCLVERAQRTYGIPHIDAFFLPNPITIPDIEKPQFSSIPTLCFLGRLEPVKRPWIFFELAKRFPKVEFLVAGIAHYPELMNPVMERYKAVSNLKFLGLVDGQTKINLLNSAWAFVNTSVHEALPVSFLEAFTYGKPVISCQNPDDLANRFGWYTGEILGEGLDDASLDRFSEAIEECLLTHNAKEEKGMLARRYVEENHTFPKFRENLDNILKMAGLASA